MHVSRIWYMCRGALQARDLSHLLKFDDELRPNIESIRVQALLSTRDCFMVLPILDRDGDGRVCRKPGSPANVTLA